MYLDLFIFATEILKYKSGITMVDKVYIKDREQRDKYVIGCITTFVKNGAVIIFNNPISMKFCVKDRGHSF